jgi:hypothetical protein
MKASKGKGLIFSTDIAVGLLILLIILFSSSYIFSVPEFYGEKFYEQMNLVSNDLLISLAELKVYEASNLSPTIAQLISEKSLTEDELEISVFNLILTLWAQGEDENNETKKELARNITRELINSIGNFSKNFNLSIQIYNSTIYGNYTALPKTKNIVSSVLVESTYSPGKPKYGYITRAYLTEIDKEDSSYLYFGGFVGQGNLSFKLILPSDANITQAYLEAYSGASFDLYINGNFSGNFTPTTFSNFSANVKGFANYTNLKPGNNTIEIRFTSGNITDWYLGGGFLRVNYKTSKFYEIRDVGKSRYYFPGIRGLINLYGGFYIPGDLNNMSIYLHYNNNITRSTIYLTIANSTIFRSNATGEQNIILDNSQILSNLTSAGLSYTNLSRKTVPIKLGTETLVLERDLGVSDAILITDVSGSMGTCDVESNTDCDCNAPPPCSRTRINVAKEVDKDFVRGMLNISGNRVGLVAYETGIHRYHELSDDKESLINEIDNYIQGGYTCICCGIKMAIEALKKPYLSTLIDNNSEWLYTTDYPTTEPPEINGFNWTDIYYNDTNWSSGKAILGFENITWKYKRAINISNTAGNLTNYQLQIIYNFSQEYAQGKIQQHCEDIRFTYYNSTSGNEYEISYWVEQCDLIANDNATIWVRVPFLENNTNTTIYMYYGCPEAQSKSNRQEVFDFYDDFEEGILNSSQWTSSNSDYAGVGNYTSNSGIFSMYTRWGAVEVTTKNVNLGDKTPIEVSYWVRRGADSFSEDPDSGEDLIVEYLDSSSNWIQLDSFAGNGIPGVIYSQKHYLSGSALHANFKLRFRQTGGSGADWDYWHIDDVIVKKYANPEPTIYVKDEEQTSKYFGDIATFIENNGGNYYFRKHFYLNSLIINRIEYLYFYLFSDDKAEVYLNGNLIYNETEEHNATYWNVGSDQIFYDGFETGINTSIWTRGGNDYPYWIIYNNPVIEGYNSSGNENIEDGEEAWIQTSNNISVNQDSIMYFYWKVSSENNWDFLSFYLNNLVVSRIDGEMGWRREKFYLPVGNYSIKWKYSKDGSVSSGSDTGWIDNIRIIEKKYHLNKKYLRDGDNVIAVKLYNNDNKSAKFDLKLEAKLKRRKAMLVMSDGYANRCCGYSTGSCWDYTIGKNDAIQAGCEARDQGILVYSVAFGDGADEGTLKKIACWNCSSNSWIPGEEGENCPRFYKSRDADELKDIYKKIAQEIANLSLERQVMVVKGNVSWANNFLYNDSYIEFYYNETPVNFNFGEFSLTIEKNFTSPGRVSLIKPNETEVLEAKITSYSGDYWTSLVTINNSLGNFTAYNLSVYGGYSKLGDPFIISIPISYIANGTNNITLMVGLSEDSQTLGSNDSKLIYKLKVPGYVGYGSTFNTSEEAKQDAVERLINKIYNLIGINISSWGIAKPTEPIRGISAVYAPSLVKIIVWEE